VTTIISEISRKVKKTRTGVEIDRVLKVDPYADADAVCDVLLGVVVFKSGALSRTAPLFDPYYPYAACEHCSIEGIGAIGPFAGAGLGVLGAKNEYESAKIAVHYRTNDHSDDQNLSEIELASESHDFGGQQLTLPNKLYAVPQSSGVPATMASQGMSAVKTFPRLDFQLTRHFVPRKPIQAALALMGRVNKRPITVGFDVYPPETLRFDGMNTKRAYTNAGVKFFEIQHKWAVQGTYDLIMEPAGSSTLLTTTTGYVGWNRIFNPQTGAWMRPTLIGGDKRPLYLFDDDYTQQVSGFGTVKGFDLLFNVGAK
jgi:hypothetical protein